MLAARAPLRQTIGFLHRSPSTIVSVTRTFTASACRGKDKVLLLDDILLATADRERLASKADVTLSRAKDRKQFIEEINGLQPTALYRHFGGARSIKVTGRFDQDLVQALPDSLRFLSHNGAGYDQLDVNALTEKGVQVSNVPTVVDDATATTALWLLIGTLRNFSTALRQLDAGHFNARFPFKTAADPGARQAKVLGIVGAGGIGKELARKASAALGMEVLYHNRNRLSAEQEAEMTASSTAGPARYVASLDQLLQRSDAVSLHCPLTPQTRHLIGAEQLAQMQPHAVLINTARGPIVDEKALADALHNGKLAGVGLDVYEDEPRINAVLQKHERALLLPRTSIALS